MGYLKIPNLYKDQRALLFKRVYALEKIHGTSAHVSISAEDAPVDRAVKVAIFSGGERYENFAKLFNKEHLCSVFLTMQCEKLTIFGEAYGGRQQGMSDTYGKELKFVAFDVRVNDTWVNVPSACDICQKFGIEFVDFELIDSTIEELNKRRDLPSTQARRNGIVGDKIREGIVIRPEEEVTFSNGARGIWKHERDEFRETKTPRAVSEEKLLVLSKAEDVATEWVTTMRLTHILDKIGKPNKHEDIPAVISAKIDAVSC